MHLLQYSRPSRDHRVTVAYPKLYKIFLALRFVTAVTKRDKAFQSVFNRV
jgi:hypothetical protein